MYYATFIYLVAKTFSHKLFGRFNACIRWSFIECTRQKQTKMMKLGDFQIKVKSFFHSWTCHFVQTLLATNAAFMFHLGGCKCLLKSKFSQKTLWRTNSKTFLTRSLKLKNLLSQTKLKRLKVQEVEYLNFNRKLERIRFQLNKKKFVPHVSFMCCSLHTWCNTSVPWFWVRKIRKHETM